MSKQEVAPVSAFLGSALIGGAIAAVLNLGLYFAAHAAGVEFTGQIEPGGPMDMAIPVPMFAVSSILPAVFAGLIAWAVRKKTEKAGVIFLALSSIFTIVSMGGPIGLAGASTATQVALGLMHVVSAVPITLALMRGPLRVN